MGEKMRLRPTILFIFLINFSLFSQNNQWTVHKVPTADALHDIEVINDSIAVVYTYGTGKIYKTVSSGRNWELLAELDSVYFEQIQFIDENEGWLVGSPNKIYSTKDGGKIWVDKHIQKEDDNQLALVYGMYFTDFNNGYVAIGRKAKTGITTNIYKTENAGRTWILINSVDEIVVNIENIGESIYASGRNIIIKNIDKKNLEYVFRDTAGTVGLIRDIELNTLDELIGVSDNGFIIKCIGNVWEKERITQNRLRCLKTFGKNCHIAVGDNNKETGNLFISQDNGKTWSKEPNKYTDIHRVSINGEDTWIVGKKGFVARRKYNK